jgi:hypothetical protein
VSRAAALALRYNPAAPMTAPAPAAALSLPVACAGVAEAAHLLEGRAHRTPVMTSRAVVDERTGARAGVILSGDNADIGSPSRLL